MLGTKTSRSSEDRQVRDEAEQGREVEVEEGSTAYQVTNGISET